MTSERERQERRTRRAYIRDNHPDRGGDPATFVAGLTELERRTRPVAVTVRSRRSVLHRLTDRAARLLGQRPPRRVR